MNNVTQSTDELVKRWIQAKANHARQVAQVNHSEHLLKDATQALGAFLAPEDAKPNEPFNIWYGSGLLAVTQLQPETKEKLFIVSWRKEPDAKQKNEQGF